MCSFADLEILSLMISHFILYVKDQKRSTDFYRAVLRIEPCLDVPGMTEFKLDEGCVLGLMPEAGIKRLLGAKLPDPAAANGVPRSELYLVVDDSSEYYSHALQSGAVPLSEPVLRDWGDVAGYCLDLDGHVLAFAERAEAHA